MHGGRLPRLAALPAGLCLTIAGAQARGAERRGTNPFAGFILAGAIGDTGIRCRIRKSGHFLETGLRDRRGQKRCEQDDAQRQFHERSPNSRTAQREATHPPRVQSRTKADYVTTAIVHLELRRCQSQILQSCDRS
jgi:hypothetical protein